MRRGLLHLLLTAIAITAAAHAAEPRPNILFMVADDLNCNLACYGHPQVQTPHLDALAKQGVLFERAYCQNPICNPSRTSFLSGLRPTTKVNEASIFLPEYLHDHGYYTVELAKLTHSYGVTATAIDWDAQEKQATAETLAAAVRTAREKKQPFFIGVGLTQTHPGYQHDREALALYPEDQIKLAEEPANFRAGVPEIAYKNIRVDELSDADRRKHIARYYAAITTLDARVGQLLAVLDKLGVRGETIVIFTSDHGRHLGEHGGIYDKRTLFENSARVPLMVSAPGRIAGQQSPRLVELVDLFPTLAELCGLPVPKVLEGTSFVPLLDDPGRAWKAAAFTSSSVGGGWGHSIRTERYRYAQWDKGAGGFLFDYQTDPAETKNLLADPNHADTLAEMRRLLDSGWREVLPK